MVYVDQETKEMFESIMQSFKNEINSRFDSVEGKLEGMNGKLEAVEGKLEVVEGEFVVVNGKLDTITLQMDRIEAEPNKDVIGMLEIIHSKMETLATKEDIDYLAGQLGKHELEIDRLKRVK
jgi:tetrahydromethanopterin S-methyltransferase subunit G